MPQQAWSATRERQYQHVKESELEQGRSPKRAREIAARTINKERARSGEARTSSRPAARKGRTKEQLYTEAKHLGVEGRSRMNKQQLQRAVDRRR